MLEALYSSFFIALIVQNSFETNHRDILNHFVSIYYTMLKQGKVIAFV